MNAKKSLDTQLAERILQELRRQPAQKAIDLSRTLGVDRREVNVCLYNMPSKVRQDSEYKWSIVGTRNSDLNPPAKQSDSSKGSQTQIHPKTEAGKGSPIPQEESEQQSKRPTSRTLPTTEIGRLCRYYLEALGHDYGEGVSTFAASSFGDLGYAELPSLPLVGDQYDWWLQPKAESLFRRLRADRGGAVAWLGYPVRLREHKTQKWSGFFVEPVMLWPIDVSSDSVSPVFSDDLPSANFAFLKSITMGDISALTDEALRLSADLGLNGPAEERPELDEVIARLPRIRPDWEWLEELDPEHCSTSPPLSEAQQSGIYNRAVVIIGKRSPFTLGLESELKSLGDFPEEKIAGTALGYWLNGSNESENGTQSAESLLEVLPMNTEQRLAVESALTRRHTVVTGPPGTGKSQVVTNFLINAAWRGQKVLFASKNNKAVDVVEGRVNGLGNRPVLLRLGSKEYQAKLSDYLTSMLSGVAGEEEEVNYRETLEIHSRLKINLSQLEETVKEVVSLRNEVDRLEKLVELDRDTIETERFNSLDREILENLELDRAQRQIDALDTARMGAIQKLGYFFSKRNRRLTFEKSLNLLKPASLHLGLDMPITTANPNWDEYRVWLSLLSTRVKAGLRISEYQEALNKLRAREKLESLAFKKKTLLEAIATNSMSLWRSWVSLAPARLSESDRRKMADYVAVLQLLSASDAQTVNSSVRSKAKRLQETVSEMFSCWAVTSLSARGKVPFEPAHFDVVVIDEASQCDIASALPLLFRAKRSVIIGDPKQLRHISSLSASRDSDLQTKFGLVESRLSWMYSVCSLYDLGASVASANEIINLRDHHRCHGDIIEFSNKVFYENKLRVATKYSALKRPSNQGPGVTWTDIPGRVSRPSGGGATNQPEANALIEALSDLLINRNYRGTVGVVTPFRAQAELISTLLTKSDGLSAVGPKADLLIDTVHKFQGDERDVIFFSPVISQGASKGALGFLSANGNLFNVAITRARGLLHVVGDRSTCGTCGVDYLEKFVSHISQLETPSIATVDDMTRELGRAYPTVARPDRVSDWERLLYVTLYDAGIKSIPQYSIDQYELDFAVIIGDRKLNIEVDGERYHKSWTGELSLRDQLRNLRLIELGWDVKRFWVYELRDRMSECVREIQDWVNSR